MPSMTLSPRQMTPSQSKMKTSMLGRRSLDGSVSFRTLAFRDVVVVVENVLLERLDVADDDLRIDDAAAGDDVKARADAAIRAAERAVLAMYILTVL
mmetsp:Transcript_20270/g.31693  ORF Transcript_20270/g.31693 Transcript_20270/m.31693 type:complete len:97 (+) Transcript_20270:239-529(+)